MQNVVNLRSLVARLHESFNDRDLDAWSEVFDDEVELVVDGGAFRGVAAARAYVTAVFREFPGLRIHGARVVAESGDTIVVEHQILNGDPSRGPLRPQGSVCEIYRVRDGRVVAYRSYYAAEGADREDVVKVPSRAEGSKMAEEQAALRRVATLVARGVSQDELFAAVNEEVGWLVGADPTSLMRFEADDTVTLVAAWSAADADFPIGARRPVDDELRSLRDGGRAVRFGPMELPLDGPFVEEARQLAIRSAVGVPIVVDGRVWGVAFAASTREEPFPEETESRIAAVHAARRDGDRQRAGTGGGATPRGRAGCLAPRRHAGCAPVSPRTRSSLRSPGRWDGSSAPGPFEDVPLRGRRDARPSSRNGERWIQPSRSAPACPWEDGQGRRAGASSGAAQPHGRLHEGRRSDRG